MFELMEDMSLLIRCFARLFKKSGCLAGEIWYISQSVRPLMP